MHWVIKENLAEFNLADFRNSPNRQNKFYAKFSSYTVIVSLQGYELVTEVRDFHQSAFTRPSGERALILHASDKRPARKRLATRDSL